MSPSGGNGNSPRCEPTDHDVIIRCTASASNTWTGALGVEPISGNFLVVFNDDGITNVIEELNSFRSQWTPQVFKVFANWVEANHPDDAAIMFEADTDINQETPGSLRTEHQPLRRVPTRRIAETIQAFWKGSTPARQDCPGTTGEEPWW